MAQFHYLLISRVKFTVFLFIDGCFIFPGLSFISEKEIINLMKDSHEKCRLNYRQKRKLEISELYKASLSLHLSLSVLTGVIK